MGSLALNFTFTYVILTAYFGPWLQSLRSVAEPHSVLEFPMILHLTTQPRPRVTANESYPHSVLEFPAILHLTTQPRPRVTRHAEPSALSMNYLGPICLHDKISQNSVQIHEIMMNVVGGIRS